MHTRTELSDTDGMDDDDDNNNNDSERATGTMTMKEAAERATAFVPTGEVAQGQLRMVPYEDGSVDQARMEAERQVACRYYDPSFAGYAPPGTAGGANEYCDGFWSQDHPPILFTQLDHVQYHPLMLWNQFKQPMDPIPQGHGVGADEGSAL